MVALIVLLLILVVLGGLGFAAHVLWFVLIAALILWALGFILRTGETVGRRRGWYRWEARACDEFRRAASSDATCESS